MKVFNLCAKVTKRHLVSLGVYLGDFRRAGRNAYRFQQYQPKPQL